MKRLNDWGTRERRKRRDRTQLIGENEAAAAQRRLPLGLRGCGRNKVVGRRGFHVQYESVIAWDLGLEKIHPISDFAL